MIESSPSFFTNFENPMSRITFYPMYITLCHIYFTFIIIVSIYFYTVTYIDNKYESIQNAFYRRKNAVVAQRLVYQPSKLRTRVRFPFTAPPFSLYFLLCVHKIPSVPFSLWVYTIYPINILLHKDLDRWCKSFVLNKIINV